MVEYHGPDETTANYRSKFVRVDDDIHVTAPGDLKTQHSELVEQDGLRERMRQRRREDPTSVDAGHIAVSPDELNVYGESTTLFLPDVDEARTKTVEVFSAKTPNRTVQNF